MTTETIPLTQDQDMARPTDQALVSDQARAGLDPSGFDPSRDMWFSKRAKVMDAIENPECVLPRITFPNCLEHRAHWQTRAVIRAMWDMGWRLSDSDGNPKGGDACGSVHESAAIAQPSSVATALKGERAQ